jgi:predicted PurR-regulated permease PerM
MEDRRARDPGADAAVPAVRQSIVSDLPLKAVEERPRPPADAGTNRPARSRVSIDITGAAVAKIVVGLLALAVVSDLLSQLRDVLVWTVAAAFLAIALNPLVERLEPRLGRRPAATVVFLGFVIGFVAVVAAFVAPFVTQVDELSTGLPQAISDAQENSTIQRLDERFHIANQAKEHLNALPDVIFGAADTVLGGAFAASTIFFLTLFLLYELPSIADAILRQIPAKSRPRARAVAQHLNRNIGGYVAGNLVISLICGAVTTISLYLLDVPYSLALGVFMAVFDLIPLVGATIGSIVVIASGFIFVDIRTGIILFVIVNVYQQIENHILQPLVYGRTVQIPSLTVLIAVLCGGTALGLLGALMAIPIAATIQAIVHELLEERATRIDLGSEDGTPSAST